MIPFAGIPIIENANCIEETQQPKKLHKRRNWMTDNYHSRIQKKWNKRFGFVWKPVAYQTPQGIVCHPAIAEQIRRAIT